MITKFAIALAVVGALTALRVVAEREARENMPRDAAQLLGVDVASVRCDSWDLDHDGFIACHAGDHVAECSLEYPGDCR